MTRQQLRADAFVRVNSSYGPEPRAARRKIALAWAKTDWRKRAAQIALSCGVLALTSIGFLTPPSYGQSSRKDDVVFNAEGRPMGGATVRVCMASASGQPCSPLANIYSDAGLTQALANPLTTDGLGNYTFYAAAGRYEIEISGPGITTKQMPNVILPNDPSTPTFTTLTTTSGISAFSLSLSGNLTVNGSTAVTGTLTVGGAPVATTTPSFVTTNAESSLPNSRQLVNGVNTTVDTSTPGRVAIDASGGGSSYESIAAYGAVTTGNNGFFEGGQLATCTGSSTAVTLGTGFASWANGMGISIYGCGATNTMSTPPAPTVTPSLAATATGTGIAVPGGTGSTTMQYAVRLCEAGGGCTNASPVTTITNSNASLGEATPQALTSCSISVTTMTCIAGASTPLAAGARVHVQGTSPSGLCNGYAVIQGVSTTTHSNDTFAFQQNKNSLYPLLATSCTGGTVTYQVENLITWTHESASLFHVVYGGSAGNDGMGHLKLLWISRPNDNAAEQTDDWVEDLGSSQSGNFPAAAWIPSTTAGGATNDALVTTIVSGGGTANVVVANAASTSASNVPSYQDNCVALNAANAASHGSGNPVLIPTTVGVAFNIGSFCQVTGGITLQSNGAFRFLNTLEISGGTIWNASLDASACNQVTGAWPGVILNNPQNSVVDGPCFSSGLASGNGQGLAFIVDTPAHTIFRNMTSSSGSNANDLQGMFLDVRGYNSFTFDNSFDCSNFTGGPGENLFDTTWTPEVLFEGDYELGDTTWSRMGGCKAIDSGERTTAWEVNDGSGIGLTRWDGLNTHFQGPIQPLLVTNAGGAATLTMTDLIIDSTDEAGLEVDVQNPNTFATVNFTVVMQNVFNGVNPLEGATTGAPLLHIVNLGGADIGQNFNVSTPYGNAGSFQLTDPAATRAVAGVENDFQNLIGGQRSVFAYQPAYPAISSAAFSGSGSAFPANTYQITYTPIFAGSPTLCGTHCYGASSQAISAVSTGATTLTATIPSPVIGAIGYSWFTAGDAILGCENITSLTCTGTGTVGGASGPPGGNAGGYPSVGSDGFRGPELGTRWTALVDGATITWNPATTVTTRAQVTLGGDRTFNVTNGVVGATYVVEFDQPASGGPFTITLGTCNGSAFLVDGGGGGSVTLSTGANAEDLFSWIVDTNGKCKGSLNAHYN